MNKTGPHGRLRHLFRNLKGFDVDKLYIVDPANQTGKKINNTTEATVVGLITTDNTEEERSHQLRAKNEQHKEEDELDLKVSIRTFDGK